MTPSDQPPAHGDALDRAIAAFVTAHGKNAAPPPEAREVAKLWDSLDDIDQRPDIAALRLDVRKRYASAPDMDEHGHLAGAVPRFSWLRRPAYAMAAAMVLAVGIGGWFLRAPKPATKPQALVLVNARAAPRSFKLSDGSQITLDADSAVEVARDGQRNARVLRGMAFFDIHHDTSRPFIVEVADNRLVDLGTAFSVDNRNGSIEVILVRGRIRADIRSANATATLIPGQALRVQAGRWAVRRLDADRVTQWHTGDVTFDNVAATDAVARLNRYLPHSIRLSNEKDGDVRISGVFRAADRQGAVRGLSALGIDVAKD